RVPKTAPHSRKEPGEEVDSGDGHADAEKHACEHSLRAAFSEGEREAGYHDGHQGKAAGDGAGKRGLQHVNGVFPRRAPRHLRESWSRENESRHGDDQFPECFLKPKDLPPMVSHFPATSLLTSSLADQVRRVLARAVWLPRGITRDQAKPFPCFQYCLELWLRVLEAGKTVSLLPVRGARAPGSWFLP